jgi:hypothetical protein
LSKSPRVKSQAFAGTVMPLPLRNTRSVSVCWPAAL